VTDLLKQVLSCTASRKYFMQQSSSQAHISKISHALFVMHCHEMSVRLKAVDFLTSIITSWSDPEGGDQLVEQLCDLRQDILIPRWFYHAVLITLSFVEKYLFPLLGSHAIIYFHEVLSILTVAICCANTSDLLICIFSLHDCNFTGKLDESMGIELMQNLISYSPGISCSGGDSITNLYEDLLEYQDILASVDNKVSWENRNRGSVQQEITELHLLSFYRYFKRSKKRLWILSFYQRDVRISHKNIQYI